MKKILAGLILITGFGLAALLMGAGFDNYGGRTVTQLLACQQFYTASASAISYSVDFDLKELTGKGQIIMESTLCATGTTKAVKLQASAKAIGASYAVVGTVDNILREGATTNAMLAASFTQSGVRQIKNITIPMKRVGAVAAGKVVTCALYADSSGPTGSALATATSVVVLTTIGTSYEPVTFTFATPYTVADSTKYWIVLAGDWDASSTVGVDVRTKTLVSGGNFAKYDESWAAVATKSMEFVVEQYNFADVTGGAFTTVTDALGSGLQVLGINKDEIPQFLRVKTTLTGAGCDSYGSVIMNFQQKNMQ